MAEDKIEAVARAFYSIQDSGRNWAQEPERLKEPFRSLARAAIAAFIKQRGMRTQRAVRLKSVSSSDPWT